MGRAANKIESIFVLLRQMQTAGVITNHALGGAFAMNFYTEPVQTFDVDVFVLIDTVGFDVEPIFSWLRQHGVKERDPDSKTTAIIRGVPVQFLAAGFDLEREAVAQARKKRLGRIFIPVIGPEHLAALFLAAPEPKRLIRVAMLLDSGVIDKARLRQLIRTYKLDPRGTL